ncbi:MAG: efflux RND transporter periplasmic adaptor subunit [Acidobacteriota bacterium]|nr:efflux RND transporter periplasmic adaptor subunit [Acidobacteriota bacterium]MDQ7086494.1 efflux RND transporter periplasmic adaptor subunit [Acidobacteriota bacterium]
MTVEVKLRRLLAVTGGALLVLAGAAAPARTPLQRPEGWILSGSLVAATAEYFRVPESARWQIKLVWLIEEGSEVGPKDAVARLDPGDTRDSLIDRQDRLQKKRQEVALHQAQAQLDRLDKQLELARAEADYEKARLDAAVPEQVLEGKDYRARQLELRKKKDELDAARMALMVSEAARLATEATDQIEIADLEEEIARYETILDNLVLRAHRPGIVVYGEHPWWGRKFQEGDQVQFGFTIASIPDLDTLEVHAWALEVDLPGIFPGQRARVRLDAFPDREFSARVVTIGVSGEKRALWGKAPYFPVTLRLDQVDPAVMKPGMSVQCELLPPGEEAP